MANFLGNMHRIVVPLERTPSSAEGLAAWIADELLADHAAADIDRRRNRYRRIPNDDCRPYALFHLNEVIDYFVGAYDRSHTCHEWRASHLEIAGAKFPCDSPENHEATTILFKRDKEVEGVPVVTTTIKTALNGEREHSLEVHEDGLRMLAQQLYADTLGVRRLVRTEPLEESIILSSRDISTAIGHEAQRQLAHDIDAMARAGH